MELKVSQVQVEALLQKRFTGNLSQLLYNDRKINITVA